ncbi:carboxylic acid transporter [Schizosaccharomyces japonicus yFS275]|uniref:Carboxylic acid transporter n=1 Tax=Schizosaccharomyces japonicus (strain yFS275 / FY16936) TaxID=402676 RepID=B6JVX8_SCHJY|nr:carboxylic acid transporter [Schizosaccharomyces japonicus yFS275]EEB05529.1 carboxylic acid transporter [Schizosaccharomyces japonicus yFS275]
MQCVQKKTENPRKGLPTFQAAFISSAVSSVVGFPFDSIKVRQQTYKFPSILACARHTLRTEGWGGFYRGMTMPLISTAITRSISFTLYTENRKRTAFLNPYLSPFVSGLCTGALISIFACPFEFSKLYSQLDVLMKASDPTYKSTAKSQKPLSSLQSARDIVHRRGFTKLWTGLPYHAMRDGFGSAWYFAIYETLRFRLLQTGISKHAAYALSGAFCGALSWILVFPVDTAKSLVQRNALLKKSTSLSSIPWFTRAMYRGISISLIRSALLNSCNFTLYELFRSIERKS